MAMLRRKTKDERRENGVILSGAVRRSRRISVALGFVLVCAISAFAAPKSASAYYGDAAFQYIENRLPTAEITCNEGLQYYPNDQKLQMLLDRIHEAKDEQKNENKKNDPKNDQNQDQNNQDQNQDQNQDKQNQDVLLAPRMTRTRINKIKVRTVSLAAARVLTVPIAMAVPESSNSLNSPKAIPATVTAVNQNNSRFNLVKCLPKRPPSSSRILTNRTANASPGNLSAAKSVRLRTGKAC